MVVILVMPVRRQIIEKSGVYFITFTCKSWLPLIALTDSYDLIYQWFDYLKQAGHFVSGYVIMPNHVHAMLGFRKTEKSINKIIGDGKRFMAYEIVKRLKAQSELDLLDQLSCFVETKDKERNKQHEIWEDSFDWKRCDGQWFMEQKLDYMHKNPCSGKWQLVSSPIEYLHSSAGYYLTGSSKNYEVLNYCQLFDLNLECE